MQTTGNRGSRTIVSGTLFGFEKELNNVRGTILGLSCKSLLAASTIGTKVDDTTARLDRDGLAQEESEP
jgi:hypothetical protein